MIKYIEQIGPILKYIYKTYTCQADQQHRFKFSIIVTTLS